MKHKNAHTKAACVNNSLSCIVRDSLASSRVWQRQIYLIFAYNEGSDSMKS